MSTKYNHGDRVPSKVLASRLGELIDAIIAGKEQMDREFTRRIPAELDRDADCVMALSIERIIELEARLEAAELRVDREAGAFRLMCEAFQRLEEILGMDTGGGMGPGPALNVVERLAKERATAKRHAVLVQAAAIDEAGYRFVDAHREYGDSTPLDAVGNFMHRMAEELREQAKELTHD